MIKNPYQKDYSFHQKFGPKGNMVNEMRYIGDYYILGLSEQQKKRTNRITLYFSGFILAILLLTGLINQDSSRTAWIVFPYLSIYICTGYLLLGTITYIRTPIRMQNVQFQTGIERMRRSSIGILILTTLSLLLDLLYMILHRNELDWMRELLYLLSILFILVTVVLFRNYYARTFGGIVIESSETKSEEDIKSEE